MGLHGILQLFIFLCEILDLNLELLALFFNFVDELPLTFDGSCDNLRFDIGDIGQLLAKEVAQIFPE